MNNNPVSNIDPLGDKIHASLRTWYHLWQESKGDAAFRQEIIRQMFDKRTSIVMRNGRQHQETYTQDYYYGINSNSNTTLRQAVFNNQALNNQRVSSNTPASNDYYPKQSFNISKTESIYAGGGGESTSNNNNITSAVTLTSKKTYQNGIVNITFTPNIWDNNGADRVRVFQGKTLLYDSNVPINPNDPVGDTNIPIPFSGNRSRIKIKITDSDGVNNSGPGSFRIKANITGF